MGLGDTVEAMYASPQPETPGPTSGPAPAPPQPAAVAGGGLGDKLEAKFQNPVGSLLDEELQRGSDWQETSRRLKEYGQNPGDYADKKKFFDLANKKKELAGRGLSFSQSYRNEEDQPWGSLFTIPESVLRPADYLSRDISRLGGKEQDVGGRVVGNDEYAQATKRFQEGKASEDDIDAIATYEHHAQVRQAVHKGANFGQKFVLELGALSKLAIETMTGTRLLTGAARLAVPARAAATALAGTAPAVPAAAAGLGAQAGNLALATAVTPSMYVPMMQQANMRAGREANDFRGLPTSFGYAYANMLVLGRLGGGAQTQASLAYQSLRKGVFGVAEMQTVDAAAGVVDQFLPKAYQIKPDDERWGNVGAWLRASRAGDSEKQSEVLRDATVQALAFSAFAAVHGKDVKGTDLTQAFADTVGTLRSKGMSKTRAGEVIGELHVKLEDALSADPYLSREGAKEALGKDLPAELKSYAEKLAETFEPASKLPSPAEVKEAMPKPPEVEIPQSLRDEAAKGKEGGMRGVIIDTPSGREVFHPVQVESRKPGDYSKVTAVDPTEPNPDRRVTVEHSDATVEKVGVDALSSPSPAAAATPPPAAPTVLASGTKPTARERADELTNQHRDLQAAYLETSRAADVAERNAKGGGSLIAAKALRKAASGLEGKLKKLVKELNQARTDALLEGMTRPPKSAAVTAPEAPVVAPEPAKIHPPVTPAAVPEPAAAATAAPAAATAAPAAAVWKYDGMRTPDTKADSLASHMAESTYKVAKQLGRSEEDARQLSRQTYHDQAFGSGEAPARVKPPEDPETHTAATLTNKLHYLVDNSPDLTREMRQYFKASMTTALSRLPAAAAARVGANLKDAKFYRSPLAAAEAHTRDRLGDPDLSDAERDKWQAHLAKFEQGVHSAAGAFNEKTGTLYIDGAAAVGREHGVHGYEGVLDASQIAGHESGHTLDGPNKEYSSDPRFTSAYLAEIGGVKHKAMAEPPLTKYATATRAEGFAEFSRLLYATDVPTDRIESEFPKTSKFFKERGLWPEERKGKAEPIKEVFNERIGDDSSHVDAKNDAVKGVVVSEPEPAAAAERTFTAKQLSAPKPKKKWAGERKKAELKPEVEPELKPEVEPEVAVEPATDWRKLDESDPDADRRVLKQLAAKYKSDPAAYGYLDSAADNLMSADQSIHGKTRREQTILSIDSMLNEAENDGKPTAVAALREAVEHFGGKFIDTVDETIPYRPVEHESGRDKGGIPGVGTGDPVRVLRQGVQLYDDGKMNRSYLQDSPDGNWYTPVKSVVEKAPAAAATPKSEGQDWWNSLSIDQKAESYNILGRKELKKQGIDFSDLSRQDKASQNRQLEGLEPHLEDVKEHADAARLSTSERTALSMTLEGKTQDAIGKKLAGVSHTAVRNYVTRALAKMQKVSTLWKDYKSAQDLIDAGFSENARLKELAANSYAAVTRDRMDKAGNRTKASDLDVEDAGGFSELRIKSVADAFLYARSGGRTLWQRLSTALFGDVPSVVEAIHDQEVKGQLAAYSFDMTNATGDLINALKAGGRPYDRLSRDELVRLTAVMRTPATSPEGRAAREGLDPKVLTALEVMAATRTKLSLLLQDIGAVDGPMLEVFKANEEVYLTRQFDVFSDPAHESKVPAAVKNRFKSWLTDQLIREDKYTTPDEVEAITLSLLRDGKAVENPLAYLQQSQLGAKGLSILKARKDIPEELRALWGERVGPVEIYATTVAKMAHLITSYQFTKRAIDAGRGKLFFDNPTINSDGEHVHSIKAGDNLSLKAFESKKVYMTLERKNALEDKFSDKGEAGWAMQWYMKALAFAKFSKVIVSHVGQIHNFMSNVLIAVRDGDFNVSKAPAAVKAIMDDTPTGRENWRKYTTLGLTGEGLTYNDFRKTLHDANFGREYFQGLSGNRVANGLLGRMLKGAAGKMTELYNYGDVVWKVYGFENAKSDYMKSGFTEAEAEARAAEKTRDQKPTYSKLAPGLQALRKSPIIAPFIAFQAEMVRTTKNTLLNAVRDMKDPRTRWIGAKSLAGMAAAATIPVALAAATRAMFGVDDSEEKALRRFLPEWQKNSRLVYFGRDPKTGHPRYTDLSRIDPHAYLSDGLIAFMRGKDASEGVKNAAVEWAKPFTQEELLLRPGIDIARNSKEPRGRVYNPQAPTLTQAGDVARHAGEPFVPAAYGPVRRMAKALAGSSEQNSGREYNVSDTAIEQAGVRIESPRVREDLANKALGFEKAKKDADKMVSDMIHAKGGVSGEELKRARDMTEEARKRTMDEFRLDVQAAERLGVPRKEIAVILKSSGVSILEIGQLFSATQVPYLPKLAGSATERVRAGQVRKLAVPSGQP